MGRKTKGRFRKAVVANAHKQKNRGSQYGYLNLPKGIQVFKETPGERVRLDFLPYQVTDPRHPDQDEELGIAMPGTYWYKRPYRIHRNVGSDNETVVCPTSLGKKCPICEYRQKLLQEGTDWNDDSVRTIKASDRNLYVVVPLDHKEFDEKPHIWAISQFLFQNKLNDELEENEEYGEFPDLEDGWTLRLRFSTEQLGKNTFADTSRIDFEKRDHTYNEKILDEVPNLDEVLICLSYKQLQAKFFEMDEVEGETEEKPKEPENPSHESPWKEEKKEPDEPKPELEKEETPQLTRTERRTKRDQEKKKDTCPFDHTFGDDCEEFDDCDTCDLFEKCLDKKEGI